MRNAFVDRVIEDVKKNSDLFIITGDAGLGVFDKFKNEYPDNFLNMGVAEQNATSFAAGMAISGYKVYLYNIIPFLLYRPYEQVRNDICYQDLPVTLVGIGSGITYAPQGMTHYAIEDVAIARTIPNLIVISPIDPIEAELAAEYSLVSKKPVYVRLAKRGEPNIHKNKNIDISKPILLKDGEDLGIIFHGSIGLEVMNACYDLSKEGIFPKIISLPMLNPVNENEILNLIANLKHLLTVEEHYITGGLGSILSDLLIKNRCKINLVSAGIRYDFIHEIKNTDGMREFFGISKTQLIKRVKEILKIKIN